MTDSEVTQLRHDRPATSDVIGTAIIGVVGGVALVMGIGYGFLAEDGGVGPGFLPVLTGAFIVVAAAAEIARMFLTAPVTDSGALVDKAQQVEQQATAAVSTLGGQRDEFGRTAEQRGRAVVKVFAVVLVAILLVPVIGLLLALGAMTFTITWWIERQSPIAAVLLAVGAVVFARLAFVGLLGVSTPTGVLGLV